jgi:two-component sensor histidine kinase/CheY-like chemotaxis protein
MNAAGKRVLYIDDDEGLGRLVQKSLARHGFVVETATSGTAAVARLKSDTFDIVALDHHLPGETGLQILQQIRAFEPTLPVVYVTGSEDSHVAVAALKAGAADYVWKDVQGHFRELLAEALNTSLESERLRRAKEEADREVRAARDRAELLLKEVNHRVSNSLAIVASLVRLQASRIDDVHVKSVLKEVQNRINAVGAVHHKLYTSDDLSSVDLQDYVGNLVRELERSQSDLSRGVVVRCTCEAVQMPPDQAVSIGILVTELVTNAFKYAYPNGGSGEIRVAITERAGEVQVVVADDGVGLKPGAPTGTGFGLRVVSMMVEKLAGTMETINTNPGTRSIVTFRC